LKAQRDVTLEVIIVDRNSSDESAKILAEHPDVRVVREPPESGLVAGYSVGVPYAKHEYFFFCNEDMWFSADCLRLILAQFDAEPRVAGVMPLQKTYDGSGLVNWGTWFEDARWYRDNPHPFRASVFRDVSEPETISGINAGACMISRTAYDAVGGWDTSFFLDYEDMDLSLRLWQQGWVCRIEPRAVAFHDVGASNGKPIEQGKIMVGEKRYVAALSNQVVIAMKSFTGVGPLAAPALLCDRFARNLLRRRWHQAKLDLRAVWLTLTRVPSVARHRQANRAWNQSRPGQGFFSDPRFDVKSRA
jgi:GT2 family glycosyltransferase